LFINERGEAAGHSFTTSIINPSTGFPTIHPFLWDDEQMLDLHTLGGTLAFANGLNNRGQVAGASTLAGDQEFHAFLWDKGKLVDFGSLGGFLVDVIGFNEAGEMVGKADLPGSATHHAFLAKDAKMLDLGTQDGDPCSFAVAINSKQQIVGASTDCSNPLHAFLWENGQMIDLNAFVPASSTLALTQATFINDGGEITAEGVLPNGDQRAILLIPCDENHPDIEACDYSLVEESAIATTQATLAEPAPATTAQQKLTPGEMQDRIRAMMTRTRRFGARPRQ
jgi:probable HAF family extracellular repeat protein